jgi:hypothetical protein
MTITRPRIIALALSLVSAGIFILSVVVMSQRVSGHYATSGIKLYNYKPVGERRFTYAGRPVSLVDEGDGPNTVVVLRYGDQEVRIPAGVTPKSEQLPGLARHNDWLRVLRFAERGRTSPEEFQRSLDAGADRLAVVARRPITGPDPRNGAVWPSDWKFEFYELLPDGSIKTETLLYPKNRPGKEPRKPGQLQERTWQMDAALMLIPAFGRPNQTFTKDALTAMGWTLPAAAFSGLLLLGSLAALFAPDRRVPVIRGPEAAA